MSVVSAQILFLNFRIPVKLIPFGFYVALG